MISNKDGTFYFHSQRDVIAVVQRLIESQNSKHNGRPMWSIVKYEEKPNKLEHILFQVSLC